MSIGNYDKIRHMVEVEDDILAVFSMVSETNSQIDNLYIAKNANISRDFIDQIFSSLHNYIEKVIIAPGILGELRWKIYEFANLRILIIQDRSRWIVVLIKSDTTLDDTVDNILGYYYETESVPKSLF
jgi:hypothetical protein